MASKFHRLQRASDPRSSSSTTTHEALPTELGQNRQSRIAAISLLYAVAYLVAWGLPTVFGLTVVDVMPDTVDGRPIAEVLADHPPVGLVAGVLSILGALAFWVHARRAELAEQAICGTGMLLLVLGAFGIAMAEQWGLMFVPENAPIIGLSWVSFWILLFPLLVPTFPKRALVGSFVAATTPFIAFGLHTLGGAPTKMSPELLVYLLPNYLAAFAAVFASKFVYRLGADASRGRKLGSYELGAQLGEGGMGEVWSAQHELLKRPAAVKVIRPERLNSSSGETPDVILRRFAREAKATAVLGSPHTVTVYDYGMTRDGTFYYVMELLEGLDLETMVKRHGPLSSERVAWLIAQVAKSLADAHANGLVHRDIKPANIFAARLGTQFDFVKVLDFGLVKAARGDSKETRLTSDGIASGTPAYMAPEVASGDVEVGASVDIYSLGCVAYWLLTGRLVFEADSAMAMVIKHVREPPEPPSAISEVPIDPELEAIVMSMLAKDPAERPKSALALACQLSRLPFAEPWNEMRAVRWWQQHAPDVATGFEIEPSNPTIRLSA